MWGTVREIRSKSSRTRSTRASWAMARRCRTAFVDPPSAIDTAMAFSNASRVMIWRGRIPRFRRLTTASPEAWARASRRGSMAGGVADPGSDMPSASPIDDIVLAVNIPAQDPSPGQATRSMSSRSSREMIPAAQAPTASNTSWMLMSLSP